MRRSVPLDRLHSVLGAGQSLSESEVAERRGRFGSNQIIETSGRGWKETLRDTARDPMIWFLLTTSALFGTLGDIAEALTLLAASVPLVGMDLFLHRRTQASTEGLSSRLAARATVLRDGREQIVPAVELVPGDLVMLNGGDAFPADGVIVAGTELQADESALTGEAFPVRKAPAALPPRADAPCTLDAAHWGWAGTRLLTGQAHLRIAYIGGETVYGEIARSAQRGRSSRTPLQRAIGALVSVLLVAAAILCVILAWVRLQQGFGLVDALLSAVTLAVAALPEEFPVVFTFFLGVGVYRLAKRQALVRRGVVVENIGRVSAICSDKTGTITEGRLRLGHHYPAADIGDRRLLALAALASRRESGDPLDDALLDAAGDFARPTQLVATFPFTEDRKRETVVVRERNGELLAAVKGAPELILSAAAMEDTERDTWHARIQELAASGHKVIGCAWRSLPEQAWAGGEPDRGFRFAGLLACEDPVRPGVAEAVAACRRAGIRVIMVTGDHPATALAVAREIGLGGPNPRVLEADALSTQTSSGVTDVFRDIDVIARAVPAQKLALVRALQAEGEIVAVTGDGVNDVPALQAADIGVAMGERATRSAREAAAIVLLDDNFRTITRAIAEGRQLFRNLQLSFAYLLMIHIPLVVTATLIPLAGFPLLYLPIHIVWLELIIHPTALLVFQELPSTGELAPMTRDVRPRFFHGQEWFIIAFVGLALTAAITLGYQRSLGGGYDVAHARAMAMVALTVASAGLTAGLSGLRTTTARIMVVVTVGASVLLVQTPFLATLLHMRALHADDWILATGAGLVAAAIPLAMRLGKPRRTLASRTTTL